MIESARLKQENKTGAAVEWNADTPLSTNGAHSDTGRRPDDLSDEALQVELSRLRRTVHELSYIVHGLSHDLREPIRIINAYVELLQTRTGINSDPHGREYTHFIATAARRMGALANGVLDYARLLGEEAEPYLPVDMNIVLQTALANLQMKIEEAHATIVHDQLPKVLGDAVQLSQLMQNLVSNAIQYRSAAPPQILVKAERVDGAWLFSVQDNGIGIAPEYFEQIFIPLQRLHGHDVSGSGLGLTICRSIVERHGGSISVDSTPGQGTTFRFTLPAFEDEGLASADA